MYDEKCVATAKEKGKQQFKALTLLLFLSFVHITLHTTYLSVVLHLSLPARRTQSAHVGRQKRKLTCKHFTLYNTACQHSNIPACFTRYAAFEVQFSDATDFCLVSGN